MLVHIFIFCIFAHGVAGLSLLIDAAMEKDMILHGYYKWLLKVCNVETDLVGNIKKAHPLYYPLGGCVKCMNFWICTIFFIIIALIFKFSWVLCFLYFWLFQGTSYHFLKNSL